MVGMIQPVHRTPTIPVLRRSPAVFAVAALLAAFALAEQSGAQQRPPMEPLAVAEVLQRHGLRNAARVERRGGVWIAEVSALDGRKYRAVVDADTGELAGLRPLPPAVLPPRSQ